MLSIILATIASILIGNLWYKSKTIYPAILKELNLDEAYQEQYKQRYKQSFHYPIYLVSEFTQALLIYGLLLISSNDLRIIIFPIFFVLLANIKNNIFTHLNLTLFLLQESQRILSILAMGIIIYIFN